MPIQINSRDWRKKPLTTTRGAARATTSALPDQFLTSESRVDEEVVVTPVAATRAAGGAPGPLDISCDLAPGEAAVLVLRHPSGALTFHAPQESTRRSRGGPGQARFIVHVRSARSPATRGLVSAGIKAVLVKVAEAVGDKVVSLVLPRLARTFETAAWKRKDLQEQWLKVTRATLAAGKLQAGVPTSTDRSLLLIHGTFSNAASAYGPLASTDFFDQVASLYGDRIFAFNHFTVSRTPEENATMLLAGLPDKRFQFDVVTHSRGGLVLRNLVERSHVLGPASSRFDLGRAVLVASPNEGTPLATPGRWEDTIGWIANLLELFPENPFTTGAEFVANGLVWIARHASGDLPGIQSMDGDGDLIETLQSPPGPLPDSYSALVSNYNPTGKVLSVMLDAGADQFFGSANDLVVPSEGGWRIDRTGSLFIPGSRIGCFGPGGNLTPTSVTHVNFFAQAETLRFLFNALAGKTQPFTPVDPSKELPDRRLLRSGGAGVSAPDVRLGRGRPAKRRESVAGPHVREVQPETRPGAFAVTVVNGDLTFESRPLLLGHYHATRLTGTEKVMNTLIGDAMKRSLDLGDYAIEAGTHRVFMNRNAVKHKPWLPPRPKAVIVAGLGQEGSLRPAELVRTVRQAVIAWARRIVEEPEPVGEFFELATTLIASGGTGITAGQSAQLIVQGVCEANELLKDQKKGDQLWPRVSDLRLIELYLDRASEAWRALKMQAVATPGRYVLTDQVDSGTGPLQRPLDSGYRGADYDFITAETRTRVNGETEIAYALDTKRARTEVRSQTTQSRLVRDLVKTASSDENIDPQIGRTLFKLLVPVELEPFLTGSNDMQIVLDEGTAGIPWELLDDAGREESKDPNWRPWAIRTKLLRKLRTEKFRQHVVDADRESHALVIGEPECPPGYRRLYGAREEALTVYASLAGNSASGVLNVTRLISDDENKVGDDARTIINTLLERDWRIVHIAGHGAPAAPDGGPGGVVLSNNTFIGSSEIKTMRVVPELVFVNCCHLGGFANESVLVGGTTPPGVYDRTLFASNIAQELINIGVRCVIAAGWAVDDGAANEFAQSFYNALLAGNRFIDAVAEARQAAYKLEGNTWAAYQCYGDADWRLLRDDEERQASDEPSKHEFDTVGSVLALKLAIETLQVQTKFQDYEPAYQLKRLANLEARWRGRKWGASNGVAELFGQAYAAAGDLRKAIEWYDAADRDADGYVPFKALEQRDSLRVRQAWHDVDAAKKASIPDDRAFVPLLDKARQDIQDALKTFDRLIDVKATAERENLRGSAMKRLAMIEAAAGRTIEARAAITEMQRYYQRAQGLVEKIGSSDLFYPASNYIAAELALHAGEKGWPGIEPALLAKVKENLGQQNRKSPEFWSIVGEIGLDFYEAVGEGKLAHVGPSLENRYADLYNRMRGGTEWGSVLDTAGFVIFNYLDRASKAEAAAALALSKKLEAFAGKVGTTHGAKRERAHKADRPRARKKPSRPGGGKKTAKAGISS